MSAKHTPGPWHWSGDSLTHRQFNIYAPNSAPSEHVCTVNNLSVEKLWQRDAAQAQANASLIAAAPELLAALQAIVEEADGPSKPYSSDSYLPPHLIQAARAAIANATRPGRWGDA
jgi:hypothetical protein